MFVNTRNFKGQVGENLAFTISSLARSYEMKFPFVAIPDFARLAEEARRMASSDVVMYVPFVPTNLQSDYESFVQNHTGWIEASLELQGLAGEDPGPIPLAIHDFLEDRSGGDHGHHGHHGGHGTNDEMTHNDGTHQGHNTGGGHMAGHHGEDTTHNMGDTNMTHNMGDTNMTHNMGDTNMTHNMGDTNMTHNMGDTNMTHNMGDTNMTRNMGDTNMTHNMGDTNMTHNMGHNDGMTGDTMGNGMGMAMPSGHRSNRLLAMDMMSSDMTSGGGHNHDMNGGYGSSMTGPSGKNHGMEGQMGNADDAPPFVVEGNAFELFNVTSPLGYVAGNESELYFVRVKSRSNMYLAKQYDLALSSERHTDKCRFAT